MKIRLFFAWYDLWMGFFWQKKTRTLYFILIPTIVLSVQFTTKPLPKQKEKNESVEISLDFDDALSWMGTYCQVACDCGRVHFCVGSGVGDYEAGELEELEVNQENNPDKYISHSDDSPGFTIIDNRTLVYNCPCGLLARYEKFIWQNRETILDYYRRRHKRMSKESSQFENKLKEVAHV
jgi:hypothetical protein